MFNIPILLIAWRRPKHVSKVIDAIRTVKPKHLFIAVDGAREGEEFAEERKLIENTKRVIDTQINWDCEVIKLYREENLGCGLGVSNAISWFFEHVEEGIIIEDDILINESGLIFLKDGLIKFRGHSKIKAICAFNPFIYTFFPFTHKYLHVWGWATYKNMWNEYEYKISGNVKASRISGINAYWNTVFRKVSEIDTWDYQLQYLFFRKKWLALFPKVNLVQNIGFDDLATHTTEKNWFLPRSRNIKTKPKLYYFGLYSIISDYLDYLVNRNRFFFEDWGITRLIRYLSIVFSNIISNANDRFCNGILHQINNFNIPRKNNIAILKLDHIGDYILFRNFVSAIKLKYEDYNIYLLCSDVIYPYAKLLDSNQFKKIYRIPKTENGIFQFVRVLFTLKLLSFKYLINTSHSRTESIDYVVSLINAQYSIAPFGDTINYLDSSNHKNNLKFYSQLINIDAALHFEWDKNSSFVEQLTGANNLPRQLSLNASFLTKELPYKYILIALGASDEQRIWGVNRMVEFLDLLSEDYSHYKIVFVGLELSKEYLNKVLNLSVISDYLDLTGNTNSAQFLNIIASASLVVCNDTATVHLSAAMSLPVICISNGRHYGRFTPYHRGIYKNTYCVYPWFDNGFDLDIERMGEFVINSSLDINYITGKKVFDVIKQNDILQVNQFNLNS